ncbi:MAG: 3-isopropylmalate dehydratase large subunit [Sedimentisphaerales bacterium]|nr:3-isopropylmalate dehydratase large subunit [Sedimentisphaerales bacterium]
MAMTITEKIFAAHCGEKEVHAGQLIDAEVDIMMCHDVTTPPAISMIKQAGIKPIHDPDRIVATPDHFQPAKDIKSAELLKRFDSWCKEHKIKNYYPVGKAGVCHALLPEQGHIRPGDVIVGGDSHTCTYGALGAFSTGVGSTDLAAAIATGKLWFRVPESMKIVLKGSLSKGVYSKDIILDVIRQIGTDGARYMAMEFVGDTLKELSMEARMTITNMAIEAGGKSGIMAVDDTVREYLKGRVKNTAPWNEYTSDADAKYIREISVDCAKLEPMVALPHLPSNGKPIGEVLGMEMDQAYIGSCTNGRIEDLRIAAGIIKGKKVKIRTIVVPATPDIWAQAMKEGLFEIFYEANCVVSAPTCGACLGGFMGILAAGDRCISTTNRNFVGRMGHPESEVYLASPATAAAAAVEGVLVDPRKYL